MSGPDAASGATRALLAVGLGVFGFGAALSCLGAGAGMAIPWVWTQGQVRLRDAVPAEVDTLRKLELARDAAYGSYLPCGSRGGAVRLLTAPAPAAAADAGVQCLTTNLGWRAPAERPGAYWVEVDATTQDFTVYGIIDADGDGEYAEYRASRGAPARVVTAPRVY